MFALRRAVVAGLKLRGFAKVRFQGLDYEEAPQLPWLFTCLHRVHYYRQLPTPSLEQRCKAASKILEEAGYTKNGEFDEKRRQAGLRFLRYLR